MTLRDYSIHLLIDADLALVNNAGVNIGVPVFVCIPVFSSFWHTPRCRIVRPYGDSIFNILRNHQHFFHSSCTVLHPHHHNMPAFIVYSPPACTQVTSRQTDISHQPETNTMKRNRAGQRGLVEEGGGGVAGKGCAHWPGQGEEGDLTAP